MAWTGHAHTGVVHHHIDALRMLLLQEVPKLLYALRLRDVEGVERDGRVTPLGSEDFGPVQLRVGFEGRHGFSTAFGRPSGEVDCERAGFEGRGRIGEGEIADCGSTVVFVSGRPSSVFLGGRTVLYQWLDQCLCLHRSLLRLCLWRP